MACIGRAKTLSVDEERLVAFEQPGLYEILFAEIVGFRDLAPVAVEVSEGDRSPVLIQLEC